MKRVWVHRLPTAAVSWEGAFVGGLRGAGIEVVPWNESTSGIGVVLFDEPDDSLEAFIRTASGGGATRVVAVSASAAMETKGWRLLRGGACDVVRWSDGEAVVRDLVAKLERWWEVDSILRGPLVQQNLIGRSPAWVSLLRQVIEVGRFTTSSVLIVGESGTGKELLAQLIHSLDPRPDKRDLVLLDCTTLAKELSGSELFGHERGAFTGAQTSRDGVFALADGGTLFLDEIGELPLPLQAQLLRAIQERTYKRVGGNTWQRVNFRLVCATNRNLLDAVERGEFRRDLYYRIAGWCVTPPPLRERAEDILPLAEHFLAQHFSTAHRVGFDPMVRSHLLRRSYPGNVRDLKQLVQRIACRHVGVGAVSVGALPAEEWPSDEVAEGWSDALFERAIRRAVALGASLRDIGRHAAETAVRVALEEADGNIQRAARQLGVTDRALQMRRASRRAAPEDFDA